MLERAGTGKFLPFLQLPGVAASTVKAAVLWDSVAEMYRCLLH